MDRAQTLALVRNVGLFSLLPDRAQHRLADSLTDHAVPFGETIFTVGDVADAMYVVVSGKARVVGPGVTGEEVSLAVLGPGSHFGEMALFTRAPRGATVRAAEDTLLLCLERRDFERVLGRDTTAVEALRRYAASVGVQNFLKQFTVLAALPAHVLRTLVTEFEEVRVEAGQTIIRQGEVGDRFFIVRRGALEAVKQEDGRERVVGQIGEGEFFGELALITGAPRAASVIARTDCDLYALGKPAFDRTLAASPEFRARLDEQAALYRAAAAGAREAAPVVSYAPAEAAEPEEAMAAPRWRRWLRRYPHIAQHDETDCGAACLAMVTAFYGVPVGVARLRDMANVDADGATMWSVAEAAETLGFHARGLQLAYDALREIKLPAIVHWEGFHYIVLYEIGRRGVVVGDPALSLKRMSAEEFRRGWTGRALELIPTPRLKRTERISRPYERFWPIVRPHLPLVGEVLLASLVLNILGLGIPLFTQMVLDRVLVHRSVDLLNMLLAGMLFIALFQAVINGTRRFLLVHVSTHADARLVADFLRHVLNLPMKFFDLRRVGDVLSRVAENEKIRAAMVGTLPGVALDLCLAAGYFALMAYYNVRLTMVVLGVIPAFVLLMILFTPAVRRNRREHFAKYADAWSYLIESITGVATVKSMAVELTVRARMESLFIDSLLVGRRGAYIEAAYSTSGTLLQTVSSTLFLWYGAQQVMANALTVGQLLAFVALAANVIAPILRLVDAWDELQDVRNAVERLNDVFDARPEEDEGRTLLNVTRLEGRIKFENVSFRYTRTQDKPTLAGVSLEIQPGETVALVGRSGSGKTTLAKLILGLYQPTIGRVLIDGHDLRTLSRRALRHRIGVVPQDVFLFSGTIRENIALGDPDVPFDRIVQAAKLAGAHEFISAMAMGYDTKVGERGMSVSGGQRQRIALARALLHHPDILLLDEATSALDTESERAIQRSLEEAGRGRTTMVIAHRLSTVRNADRILVLDNGAIVEEGAHAQLMRRQGLYAHLVGSQVSE